MEIVSIVTQGALKHRDFNAACRQNRWTLLVSGDGQENSIAIRQNAAIYVGEIDTDVTLTLPDVTRNHARLLFVIKGDIALDGLSLTARDEAQILDHAPCKVSAETPSKLLLFDVPV